MEIKELITLLQYKKQRNEQFSISFVIVIRELLYRKDENSLVRLFQEPAFQFANLPYDEVAQIGVLIGLHFRNSPHSKLELRLLELPNFRDLVFKIFVDYGRLHQKYGVWLRHLLKLRGLDNETMVFSRCIEIWRLMLSKQAVPPALLKTIPLPSKEQHPILFGRIFGIQLLCTKNHKRKEMLYSLMQQRIQEQPHYVTELLYEPSVQSLVLRNPDLTAFVLANEHLVNDIKFWYHFSQVSIHKVFQVSVFIADGKLKKASQLLNEIPYGHIRHGYREFIELFVSFFRWKIAQKTAPKQAPELLRRFELARKEIGYKLFSDAYFQAYFES